MKLKLVYMKNSMDYLYRKYNDGERKKEGYGK